MSFSIITPVISTLLLVAYIALFAYLLSWYNIVNSSQDITNSSFSTRTLQITLSPEDGDTKIMYGWLTNVGFFNVSRVPGGFKITWSISHTCRSCLATGGRCFSQLYNRILAQWKNYEEYCMCPNNEVQFGNCSDVASKLMAGIFFGELGAFVVVLVSYIVFHRGCCCKRTESDEEQTILQFMDPLGSRPATVEDFLNYYFSQVPNRYSYAQIRTYTNNLAEQHGKRGFGTVYRGKPPVDG